ncbi:MAG TPA: zinc-dependent alcohol dehydrogenase family protein [Eoetvoesiella sp.]
MKAIQIHAPGGPEVLKYIDLPTPQAGPGDLLVRARVIGVGKPDALIRQGIYRWMPALPAIPGNEMVGEIVEVGAQAGAHWTVGERVLVSSRELTQRGGCYAEAICVPANAVFRLPDSVSDHDAISLPNYQIAGALLFESGLAPVRSILVHGAAGGVAIALMQLAAQNGITAIGTASTMTKTQYSQQWHQLPVIDRSSQDVRKQVHLLTQGQGVDLVLDHVGGPDFISNFELLAPLGTVLSYNALGGLPTENLLEVLRRYGGRSLGLRCYSIHTLDDVPAVRRGLMQQAIDLLASGRIAPPAPTALPLSQAQQAHTLLDQAQLLGKIILVPDSGSN